MRFQKFSLIAVAVAAGLSLTACQGGDDTAGGASDSSASSKKSGSKKTGPKKSSGGSASAGTSGDTKQTGASSGGSSKAGSNACQTSQLAFSTTHGMGEGTLVVHLENTGSATCALKGFPGADLKSKDGTVSATRSERDAPLVRVEPGEETRFTLNYPPNHSGGSGVTYTELVVTPPNETHSHTLPVEISVPVTDGSGPAIKVHPVGTGK